MGTACRLWPQGGGHHPTSVALLRDPVLLMRSQGIQELPKLPKLTATEWQSYSGLPGPRPHPGPPGHPRSRCSGERRGCHWGTSGSLPGTTSLPAVCYSLASDGPRPGLLLTVGLHFARPLLLLPESLFLLISLSQGVVGEGVCHQDLPAAANLRLKQSVPPRGTKPCV